MTRSLRKSRHPAGPHRQTAAPRDAFNQFAVRHLRWLQPLILLLLGGSTVAAYWRVRGFGFLNYDDFYIFFGNGYVRGGLSADSLSWALTTTYYEYWHPVMWWSHMLDWQLYGAWAGGHHLTNLGLHVANSLLVYAVLRQMTGKLWRSAVVAGLFALHPLHVESVAWLAERKDVLSAFFALCCLWAYGAYARRAKTSAAGKGGFYWMALLCFALGLLTKPMVITLPFVLLLLDYWPLNRNADCGVQIAESKRAGVSWLSLVREKLPFFALTLVFCIVTWWSVTAGNHLQWSGEVPWTVRLANIPSAYIGYLWKTVWPVDLAVLYPLPEHWQWWKVALSTAVLSLTTWGLFMTRRQAPYGLIGWLIFLGMLVPTIGLVSVGPQAMADRYMYLPSIGISAAVVWGVADLARQWQVQRFALAGGAAATLAACGYLTWVQTGYWRDSVALWSHCLEVAPESSLTHYNMGANYLEMGRMDDAIREYDAALRLKPDDPNAKMNMGVAFMVLGRPADATNWFGAVLRQQPDDPKALANMGQALAALGEFDRAMANSRRALEVDLRANGAYNCIGQVLSAQGKSDEAIDAFRKAIDLRSTDFDAHYQLGVEYLKQGRPSEAVPNFRKGLEIEPANWNARVLLASSLDQAGSRTQAIVEYRTSLELKPDWPEVQNNLAWILATDSDDKLRNGAEAVELAGRACAGAAEPPTMFVGTLAAAYAEAGQFEKAVETAQKACGLATARGELELVKRNQELVESFRNRKPYREVR